MSWWVIVYLVYFVFAEVVGVWDEIEKGRYQLSVGLALSALLGIYFIFAYFGKIEILFSIPVLVIFLLVGTTIQLYSAGLDFREEIDKKVEGVTERQNKILTWGAITLNGFTVVPAYLAGILLISGQNA